MRALSRCSAHSSSACQETAHTEVGAFSQRAARAEGVRAASSEAENGGATWLFPDVGSAAGCGDGGWYYDNPDEPGWIILCEETCELVTAEGSGGLEIRLACVIG